MKLGAWMENRNFAEVAERLQVTTACLRYWVNGLRRPRPENMKTIRAATRGAVTEADFPASISRERRLMATAKTTRAGGKPKPASKPVKKPAPKKAAPKKAAPKKAAAKTRKAA